MANGMTKLYIRPHGYLSGGVTEAEVYPTMTVRSYKDNILIVEYETDKSIRSGSDAEQHR